VVPLSKLLDGPIAMELIYDSIASLSIGAVASYSTQNVCPTHTHITLSVPKLQRRGMAIF